MGTISGILVPTLGVLTAAGIIKGVTAFLALDNIGVLNPASGLYMLLYAIGDGFFYFLPIILGVTAARKFKCNEFIGATVEEEPAQTQSSGFGGFGGGARLSRDGQYRRDDGAHGRPVRGLGV